MKSQIHDVIIVGGGVSGTSLLYTLARYTDVRSVALIEKYGELAALNSSARANSQTLHCGDIETNYTLEKAANVKQIANMILRYGDLVPEARRHMFVHPKMVLGVGEPEVEEIARRHAAFSDLFPYMQLWDRRRIAQVEPDVALVDGRPRREPILASGTLDQVCAIDYGGLSRSFVEQASATMGSRIELLLRQRVTRITPEGDGYAVRTDHGRLRGRSVAVCAGAHSLLLGHEMGFGLEYALLPVAGSFYYIPRQMRGKVYTLQNPKLPFAALHADPDVAVPGKTRLGPTALLLPKLERYRSGTYLDFLRVLKPDRAVAAALWELVRDPDIRRYIVRNLMFEVPGLRRHLFARDARKIIPSLREPELQYAHGIGGIRPQIIDRRQRKLLLGEAVINPGNGILFSITPSPGATTCLGNARENAQALVSHLGRRFDEERHARELDGRLNLSTAA